jgi:hypothetical protein
LRGVVEVEKRELARFNASLREYPLSAIGDITSIEEARRRHPSGRDIGDVS